MNNDKFLICSVPDMSDMTFNLWEIITYLSVFRSCVVMLHVGFILPIISSIIYTYLFTDGFISINIISTDDKCLVQI